MTYLGAFCYLPALQTKLGAVCVVGTEAFRQLLGAKSTERTESVRARAPPNLRGTLLRVPREIAPDPGHARADVRDVRRSLKVKKQCGSELTYFFTSTERTESARARRTTEPARDPSQGPPRDYSGP